MLDSRRGDEEASGKEEQGEGGRKAGRGVRVVGGTPFSEAMCWI